MPPLWCACARHGAHFLMGVIPSRAGATVHCRAQLDLRAQPVKAVREPVARRRGGGLNEPRLLQAVEAEAVGDGARAERVRQVNLVGKDEHDGVGHAVLREDLVQLVARLCESITIAGVDNEDQRIGALVVMTPCATEVHVSKRARMMRTRHEKARSIATRAQSGRIRS